MKDEKNSVEKPLSDEESLERMVLDQLRNHYRGLKFTHLRDNITVFKLTLPFLDSMVEKGLLQKVKHRDMPTPKFRIPDTKKKEFIPFQIT